MTRDDNAQFNHEEGFHIKKWLFFGEEEWHPPKHRFYVPVRNGSWSNKFSDADYKEMEIEQREMPVPLMTVGRKRWWWFREAFYSHSIDDSEPEVIKGLIHAYPVDAPDHNRQYK
ncbi:MAG: hypothetical protein WCS31_11460 [Verrucomicrobiae bacterium]